MFSPALSHPRSPCLAQRGVVVLLCLTLGLQWTLLQGIAWTSMFIGFASEGSVIEAVEKTFDGQHPCPLCTKVKEGSQESSPENSVKSDALVKLDAVLVRHAVLVPPAAEPMWYAPLLVVPICRSEMPEPPPPRRALA